jgi:hypothetical protein
MMGIIPLDFKLPHQSCVKARCWCSYSKNQQIRTSLFTQAQMETHHANKCPHCGYPLDNFRTPSEKREHTDKHPNGTFRTHMCLNKPCKLGFQSDEAYGAHLKGLCSYQEQQPFPPVQMSYGSSTTGSVNAHLAESTTIQPGTGSSYMQPPGSVSKTSTQFTISQATHDAAAPSVESQSLLRNDKPTDINVSEALHAHRPYCLLITSDSPD